MLTYLKLEKKKRTHWSFSMRSFPLTFLGGDVFFLLLKGTMAESLITTALISCKVSQLLLITHGSPQYQSMMVVKWLYCTCICNIFTENLSALKRVPSSKEEETLMYKSAKCKVHSQTDREYCINSLLKILSISSSHTNGHPAVVPMVTALNHVVADGRRAGGLNLSSSILTDYRERERARQAKVPPS